MTSHFKILVEQKLQACATRALEINPKNPDALVMLAHIRGEAEGLTQALGLYAKATQTDLEEAA